MELIEELKKDQFNKPFLREYDFLELLGKGGFSVVFKAVRWSDEQ